jgi:transcription-repair coupling factor (superfamily II helicase)
LQVIQLKKLAKKAGVLKIEEKKRTVSFVLDESASVSENDLLRLLDQFKGRLRFVSSFSFEITRRSESWEDLFLETAHGLKTLAKGEG